MLVTLGFLCASLLALAALPSLARRADRLARKRAEAAFPLSLAEIAADRDHLRAELALHARAMEQKAERGFAARAGAMQEVGQRDMRIARLEGELAARDADIAGLRAELTATRDDLAATRVALATETAGHVATQNLLDKRIADIASLEASLAETRASLSGTSADLAARSAELGDERATLGRIEALLAEREAELSRLRFELDALRVSQVESRTQILVLEGKRDELSDRLTGREQALAEAKAALGSANTALDLAHARIEALEMQAAGLATDAPRLEDVLSEVATLRADLARMRAERTKLKRKLTQARKAVGSGTGADNAALRREISQIAERLMTLRPVQEAAE